MSIKSMTGFAREAGVSGSRQWVWEIKTVNGRGLDVRLRNPPGFDDAGEDARQGILKALSRGTCQLTLTLADSRTTPRVRVNHELLRQLVETLRGLDIPDGVRPASVDALLGVRGVIETEEESADEGADAALKLDIKAGAVRLVAALQDARAGEGAALSATLEGQLAAMAKLVEAAETNPSRQPEAIRKRLAEQLAPLIEGSRALDPERLHQEAALLATRADIREELDRLNAHIASARELLAAGGAIGRRLDFLAQEFGRESNTLCAKANDVSLSRIGLDLKAVVEQFREQVQNVE